MGTVPTYGVLHAIFDSNTVDNLIGFLFFFADGKPGYLLGDVPM